MVDDSRLGLIYFEEITLESALMADKILNLNMKIETAGPVGSQPKKLVSNTGRFHGGWQTCKWLKVISAENLTNV